MFFIEKSWILARGVFPLSCAVIVAPESVVAARIMHALRRIAGVEKIVIG
jgi:hypothetical protein